MKQIGLMKALWQTMKTGKLTQPEREVLRNLRFNALVRYARTNSPYFRKLYSGIGDKFAFSDLPVTNKRDMMANFDEWITDSSVTLSSINKFMENKHNIGRLMDDKYLVLTTSGSTGNPAVVLYDKTALNVLSAIDVLRSFARKEDMSAFIKKGRKTAGVFATEGFYLGCGTAQYNLRKMPWKRNQLKVTSILKPVSEIVDELNAFQPAMLGGYPTALELLMEEQKAGRLHITPALIMTGGEYLSDMLRSQLKDVFGCYVQTNYSCTEGGTIACECREGHFHINDDWFIIEAVNENNQPVPCGKQSAKILLTNLSNYTQPFIRYELGDRVIIHEEPCNCGKSSQWLEIEGRTDEILTFETPNGNIRIQPLALYILLKEIHEIRRFQLVQHGSRLELRLECLGDANIRTAFETARSVLLDYLRENGITNVEIYLSETRPMAHPKSGKFKHVYKQD